MNPTDRPYVLHGFDVSYFTAKARAALRYKQVFLEEKRANVRWIVEQTGHAFVPVVTTPEGEVWQDTSDILDALEARHPTPPLQPGTPVHRIVCALIEVFADEVMLTAAMHTRWGTEEGEALTRRRFGAMTGSLEQGNRAADQMVKARYAVGATPEAAPAIDAHLTAMLAVLSAHFETHDFVLGDRMSVADCALMGPIYAHFYTDLLSRRLLLETALPVVRWIESCTMPGADDQGDWLADDALPDTLLEVLRTFGHDGAPLLVRLAEAIEAWADEHAVVGETPPRAVGVAEWPLRGATLTRGVQVYSLWMLQRILDPYGALSDADRARVDSALAGTGWEPVLAYSPRHRLEKKGFDLVFAEPARSVRGAGSGAPLA